MDGSNPVVANTKKADYFPFMIFLYNLLQDEWELILNFIVTFPSVIKSTVPKITLKSHNVIIQTNKVNILAELPESLHRALFS